MTFHKGQLVYNRKTRRFATVVADYRLNQDETGPSDYPDDARVAVSLVTAKDGRGHRTVKAAHLIPIDTDR